MIDSKQWTSGIFACCMSVVWFLGGCGLLIPRDLPRNTEELRVTSPNGELDAVLVRDETPGGGMGNFEWNLYIVLNGKPVRSTYRDILFASTLQGERIAWVRDHLLEIRYDVAEIDEFRNLWRLDEVQRVGSLGEGDYYVEIRLAPSSPDFSLLTSTGSFK